MASVDYGDELDLISDEDEEEINAIMDDMGSGSNAEIRVYQLGKGRESDYVFRIEGADFTSFSDIMEQCKAYGSGVYRADFRVDHKYKKRQRFGIKVLDKPEETPKKDNNEIVALIAAMNESSQRASQEARDQNQQFMRLMMDSQQRAAENQSTMLLKIMEIQASNKPTDTQPDMLSVLTSAKTLFQPDSNSMEDFMRGIEFAKDMNPSDDPLTAAVNKLGTPLLEMTKGLNNVPQPVPTETPSQPVAGNRAPAPGPQQAAALGQSKDEEKAPMNPMVSMILQKYKPMIDTILAAAYNNLDPEIYCDMVLDLLEKTGVDLNQVLGVITNDEHYAKIFQWIPPAANYRVWFDQLRALLVESLSSTPEDNSDVFADDSRAPIPDPKNTPEISTSDSSAETTVSSTP